MRHPGTNGGTGVHDRVRATARATTLAPTVSLPNGDYNLTIKGCICYTLAAGA